MIKRRRRVKLFVFLRQHRHELCTDTFQQELLTLYKDQPQGHPPVPPAQLPLATLLQADAQVSADEGIEATTMARRWQVVLDCLDGETPPFRKGALVVFRQHLSAHQMDRRRLGRTVEIAATSGAFGSRQVRAALDSSPRWGAGRVEDTSNLLGHALRKALDLIAQQQGRGALGVTPAHAPVARVTDAIETHLAAQQSTLKELHIDRAYLAGKLAQQRSEELAIVCKAWPVRPGPYFPISAFWIGSGTLCGVREERSCPWRRGES